jgi:dihydroxyacetone kinase
MKKLINQTEDIVVEMCKGMVQAHADRLCFNEKYRVITRKQLNSEKVTLISGGGSGHEPAHGGYVGTGMLDAAVCGDVFASPSTIQIYNAIRMTQSTKGTLLIIKNYSGDRMNFDAAAEMAEEDGVIVDKVYVNDDIAVQDSLYTIGRRGVAGTVFVHKIAGAMAERGNDLAEVKRVAQKAISNTKSIGVAYTSCTVPAKGTPTFELADDEMEFGVGIHGEPGVARMKVVPAKQLAERMIEMLTTDLKVQQGEGVALLVNGFGATPLQELYVLAHNTFEALASRGITIWKCYVGNYMTSIDMAGASQSIMRLDEELLDLLNDGSDAPAFLQKNNTVEAKSGTI